MSDLKQRLLDLAAAKHSDLSVAAEAAERIAELEAALRFYADAENWRLNGPLDPNSGNFTGGPARAVIKKDRQP